MGRRKMPSRRGKGEKKKKRGIWIKRRAERRKMRNGRRSRMGRRT
jgi:hypothetical protein